MQAAKAQGAGRVIGIDALPLRCELARELGIDEVIDASAGDPVAQVLELTDGGCRHRGRSCRWAGRGAGVCRGAGHAQARRSLAGAGPIRKRTPTALLGKKSWASALIGSYLDASRRPAGSARTLELLTTNQIQFAKMITHRFPYTEAAAAFDLLYNRLGETMAVLLVWDN